MTAHGQQRPGLNGRPDQEGFEARIPSREIDHILGFTGADSQAMTGAYSPGGWEVRHITGTDPLLALLTSQHEAEHSALNASSSWGTALLTCHVAHQKTGDPAYRHAVRELVRRCRTTHEAFATHTSVFVITSNSETTSADLLARYPDYQRYHELAHGAGPDPVARPYWHCVAVSSALMACMQTPVLDLLAEHGPERFATARVLREFDSPDARFGALRRTGLTAWAELKAILAEALGPAGWRRLSSTPADGSDPDAFDAEVWHRLQAVTFESVRGVLEALGFATPGIEDMMTQSARTLTRLRELVPEAGRIFVPPGEYRTDALSLFELENLTLRAPRRAVIRRWADVAGLQETVTATGEHPRRHVYVCVRSLGRLRRQFDLDSGHLADRPSTTPVTAVLVPVDEGREGSVELLVLDDPDELADIPRAGTDLGVVVNYSLACSLDQAWSARWLPKLCASGRATALFDTLPRQTVPPLLASGLPLGYALISVRGEQEDAYVLCLRAADDPLLLLPCSFAAGQSLASWIHYTSGERLRSDLAVLGRDEADTVPVVVGHLVGQESVVGVWAAA